MSEPRQIVTTERVGAVAVLTIDNPPVNATSRDVRRGRLVLPVVDADRIAALCGEARGGGADAAPSAGD